MTEEASYQSLSGTILIEGLAVPTTQVVAKHGTVVFFNLMTHTFREDGTFGINYSGAFAANDGRLGFRRGRSKLGWFKGDYPSRLGACRENI